MADDAKPASSPPTLADLEAAGHDLEVLSGKLSQEVHEEADKTAALHKLYVIGLTYGPDLLQLVFRAVLTLGGIPLPKAV